MPAVPVKDSIELRLVQQIASELEKLAKTLRGFSKLTPGTRDAGPAQSLVDSLKKVNATVEEAARRGSLGSAGFATIGREFESIGATLRALGSDSKPSSK